MICLHITKEKRMENNVLVIGNGYDLAHNLKTKYDDFIQYIRAAEEDDSFIPKQEDREFIHKCIETNGFLNYFLDYTNEVPGWVDLEKLIKEVVNYFEIFFENCNSFINARESIELNTMDEKTPRQKVRVIDCLSKFELFDKDNSRGYIFSRHMHPIYYTNGYGLNKKEVLKFLKAQLDDVIELLQRYLIYTTENLDKIGKIQQIADINPRYVISFNYTYTYKRYGIRDEDVFHVHGRLLKNNMVLGFNDEDPENLDFVYFKKYFQRIQKLTGYINKARLMDQDADLTPNPIIHFYGHSMDKTDGDIIGKLKSLARGFVIYTYDQEDYEQKVINLIDVFKKEEATKMIQTGFIKFVQIAP